jgi:hypothetical protein
VYVTTVGNENVEVQFCMIVLSGTCLKKKNVSNPVVEVPQGKKTLQFARSQKRGLSNLRARVQRCSAERYFAANVTGFRKQKLCDYVRSSSYFFFTFL